MKNIELTKNSYGSTKLLDALRFIVKARAKESTRYAISAILVEKDCIVATDGRRLHWVNINHPFEEGLYDVVKCTRSYIFLKPHDGKLKFPRWRDIVPKHKIYFTASAIESAYVGLGGKNIAIKIGFLQNVLEEYEVSEIYIGEPDRPIYVKRDDYNAVIMPINHDTITYKAVKSPKKSVKKHKK